MPAKAAATYKKVLKLDPHHESALLQLVEACAQQGQLADAKTHLRSAIEKRRSAQRPIGRRFARHSSERARSERLRGAARRRLDIRVRTGKATAADLLDLARELDSRGRTEESEALLEEVVRRDPGATGGAAAPRQRGALARRARSRPPVPARRLAVDRSSSCCSPRARSLLKVGDLDGGARAARPLPVAATRTAPKRLRRLATHSRGSRRATRWSTCSSIRHRPTATTARRRGVCRGSSIARRDMSRPCCASSRCASTAISTRR